MISSSICSCWFFSIKIHTENRAPPHPWRITPFIPPLCNIGDKCMNKTPNHTICTATSDNSTEVIFTYKQNVVPAEYTVYCTYISMGFPTWGIRFQARWEAISNNSLKLARPLRGLNPFFLLCGSWNGGRSWRIAGILQSMDLKDCQEHIPHVWFCRWVSYYEPAWQPVKPKFLRVVVEYFIVGTHRSVQGGPII
jgi:hypothetical protein